MKTVGRSGEILFLIILHISYDNNTNYVSARADDLQMNSQSDTLH
jgi:hypothetical protein